MNEQNNSSVIDLTYPVTDTMVVYPGLERPVFHWVYRVNSEEVNLTKVQMIAHTGTHADSPMHFLENVRAIDEIPVRSFCGRAKLFRFKEQLNAQEIRKDDIITQNDDLRKGDIFVLETGIARYAETQEYNTRYPVPSDELLDYLIERKIAALMTDVTSIDPLNSETNSKHKHLLSSDIPIVENLYNLHMLPEKEYFFISALPLKLQGREGAPCRAVAILRKDLKAMMEF